MQKLFSVSCGSSVGYNSLFFYKIHCLLNLHICCNCILSYASLNLFNINIPENPKGFRITRQGGPYYSDDFFPIGDDLYRPRGKSVWVDSHDDTLDTDATFRGYITVTPLTIDKTNNVDQFNMKKAGAIMRAQRDEKIVPEIDTYRLQKWSENGGIHKELDAEPTKKTIASQIISLHNDMLDAGVPDSGVTLLIRRKYLPDLKLAEEWVGLDSLGGKTLPKGCLGEFDGMEVVKVPSSRFPTGVNFMIVHRRAACMPMKIKKTKIHQDPPGINGNLMEGRQYYDCFVFDKLKHGIYVDKTTA